MTLTLTADEIRLLRELIRDTAYLIAHPEYEIEHWVSGSGGGGSPWSTTDPDCGFGYEWSDRGAIVGTWKRRHTVTTYPLILADHSIAGHPSTFRFDEPHRRVRLTHKRCLRWAHSLPVDIRYRGAHQVWVDRMTIGRCHRSLIEAARYALDTTPVKREPVAASAQLDLFESA